MLVNLNLKPTNCIPNMFAANNKILVVHVCAYKHMSHATTTIVVAYAIEFQLSNKWLSLNIIVIF